MENAMNQLGARSGQLGARSGKRRSFNQLMLSQSVVNPSPGPTPINLNPGVLMDSVFIMVTADAKNYFMIDVTGAKRATFIRERIFSKVAMPFV